MTAEDVRELTDRRNKILNKLRIISEARGSRAMSPDKLGRVGGTTSSPPPGVDLGRIKSQTECPDKDRSLFEFYAWQFSRPNLDAVAITKLVYLAERDHEDRSRTGVSTEERDRARNRSILSTMYRGQPPEVVAACERCSHGHVRTHRARNGLDPLTGVMVR